MNKTNLIKFKNIALRTAILSTALALSGCVNKDAKTNTKNVSSSTTNQVTTQEKTTITAIIIDNNKLLLIDLKDYEKYISYLHYSSVDGITRDRTWVLTTTNNEVLFFGEENIFCFIKSPNSHEKARAIANYYYGDNVEEYENIYSSLKLTNN